MDYVFIYTLKTMAITDILGSIFSSGASKLTDSIGKGLDNLFTSKEEVEKAKIELTKVVNSHIEELGKQATAVQIAEIEAQTKEMDSARQREIAIVTSDKAPLLNKIIQPILAILILGSCFLFWYILYNKY